MKRKKTMTMILMLFQQGSSPWQSAL